MEALEALAQKIAHLDAARDFDGLRQTRQQLLHDYPDSDAACEALYKIGLDLLFRQRLLDEAVEHFEQAAKRPQPFWSAAARTSLGLCYFHQQKVQKALFELRKVAYPKAPNVHSVTALAFIENIFVTDNRRDEASRVRRDRIGQLEQLISHSRQTGGSPAERGYFLYQVATALADHGEKARAKAALEEARALGAEAIGAELARTIDEALAS